MAINNWNVLAVQWSLKYLFAPNFPIFWKSRGEEDGKKREMQSALLFKQTQQGVPRTTSVSSIGAFLFELSCKSISRNFLLATQLSGK